MSWDGIYTELFTLLSDANTGLNPLLVERNLQPIQAWMREELTKDIAPAGILTHQSTAISPLSSPHTPYYEDKFLFAIHLREPTPSSAGRETKARRYLDAVKDFLIGKKVAGCHIELGEPSIDFPDPTHTVVGINIIIHHPGGET